jgi:hypothetical protein
MNIIDEVQASWGWTGIDPVEIVGENDFGNLMIKDAENRYWRLCPEDLYCKVVADNKDALDKLTADPEFLEDWYMHALAQLANKSHGPLGDGRKYCFITPGPLGGEYAPANIKTAPLDQIIRLSGDVALQIKDVPDGAKIRLTVKQ